MLIHLCRILRKSSTTAGGRLWRSLYSVALRPHFAGLAYVRKGSETFDASEQQFDELIARRNSKAARILQWKGKNITAFVRNEDSEIPWPKSTTLVDCDQFYVTIQAVPHEPPNSYPLSRVEINFDNLRKTLQLEISDPNRNAWDVELERSARQVLGHMMTHDGCLLLRWLMLQGRVEVERQFMPEVSSMFKTRRCKLQFSKDSFAVRWSRFAIERITYLTPSTCQC